MFSVFSVPWKEKKKKNVSICWIMIIVQSCGFFQSNYVISDILLFPY